MSAGHIDWHEDEKNSIKVCAILDDSSRKILAGGATHTYFEAKADGFSHFAVTGSGGITSSEMLPKQPVIPKGSGITPAVPGKKAASPVDLALIGLAFLIGIAVVVLYLRRK